MFLNVDNVGAERRMSSGRLFLAFHRQSRIVLPLAQSVADAKISKRDGGAKDNVSSMLSFIANAHNRTAFYTVKGG